MNRALLRAVPLPRYLNTLRKHDVEKSFLQASAKRFRRPNTAAGGPKTSPAVPTDAAADAFAACAHIVSEGSGSAVVVHPSGTILTCCHCVAHDDDTASEDGGGDLASPSVPDADRLGRMLCLVLPCGRWCVAVCVAATEALDAAVLQAAWSSDPAPYPAVPWMHAAPHVREKVLCVGNPGRWDLESKSAPGTRPIHFNPPIFHTSSGAIVDEDDAYVAMGLGGAKHTCWTYWGHSGAPLFTAWQPADTTQPPVLAVAALHNSWVRRVA